MQDERPREDTVALRIRQARVAAGLSQGQVAQQLGVHRPTISEIEAGRRKVSSGELVALAKLFKVGVEWLSCSVDTETEQDAANVLIAARELSKLRREDLERLLEVIRMLKSEEGKP